MMESYFYMLHIPECIRCMVSRTMWHVSFCCQMKAAVKKGTSKSLIQNKFM